MKKRKNTSFPGHLQWLMLLVLFLVFPVEKQVCAQSTETVLQPERVTIYRPSSPIRTGTFEYDGDGTLLKYHEDLENDSTHLDYTISYDDLRNVVTVEVKDWGYADRYPYMYGERYDFSYGDHGRIEGMEVMWHDGHNDEYWVPQMRWLPEYDGQGRMATDSMYSITMPDGYHDYQFLWEHRYAYGDTWRQTLYTYQDDGLKRSRIAETYDANGRVSTVVLEQQVEESFVNSKRWDYSYGANGIASMVRQAWDGAGWQNDRMTLYSYDPEGNLLMKELLVWDGVAYVNHRRTRFILDGDGLPQTILFEQWEQDSWQEGVNDDLLLIADHLIGKRMSELIFDNRVANDGWNRVLLWLHNDFGVSRIDFSYVETATPPYRIQASGRDKEAILVHPNPGKGRLSIETPIERGVVRIYDSQGRPVHAQPFSYAADIDTDGLAKGIYVWEVWDGDKKAAVGKWVKD